MNGLNEYDVTHTQPDVQRIELAYIFVRQVEVVTLQVQLHTLLVIGLRDDCDPSLRRPAQQDLSGSCRWGLGKHMTFSSIDSLLLCDCAIAAVASCSRRPATFLLIPNSI